MKDKKIFNPKEWLDKPSIETKTASTPIHTKTKSPSQSDVQSLNEAAPNQQNTTKQRGLNGAEAPDLEKLITQIQEQHIDLTSSYESWRDIGFALADELGESGRDHYHKISRFHKDYNFDDCNKQYNSCLKSKGHGVTIKTLFYKAKEAGIIISNPKISLSIPNKKNDELSKDETEESPLSEAEGRIFDTPHIPAELYTNLPQILQESTAMFDEGVERDVFLVGALSVLSACLPNIEGIYFDEPVSAHLYSFITAPAGSGKGKLKWAKFFALHIHKAIVEQSKVEYEKYEQEIEEYLNLNKNQRKDAEKPQQPKRKMFFIPANSSSSAFIQALADNDFKGIIFETEADTLAATLKQDWGNFSDILRKAFHHESTNMFRRKDNEHIEIEDPHLAIALSGTPKQVHNMMPDTENGLFSRFLYYAFEDYSDFKNPFVSHNNVNYTQFFEDKAQEVQGLYDLLKPLQQPLRFTLTEQQGQDFTQQFNTLYKRNRTLMGNDFNANSRRLGLIAFRLAMVLRSLRILEDGDTTSPLLCNEIDYQTAINLTFTLEKHAIAVFNNLPKQEKLKGIKQDFYKDLPKEFDRQGYLQVAHSLNIKDKTAEKYIGIFKTENLLLHEYNKYTK